MGPQGPTGATGTSVSVAAAAAGGACAGGGVAVTAGSNTAYVCNGVFPNSGATLGTQSNPAASCLAIITANPAATDGVYWLQMSGEVFQAYCDQTTAAPAELSDGGTGASEVGGWTLCLNSVAGSTLPVEADITTNSGIPDFAHPHTRNCTALADQGHQIRHLVVYPASVNQVINAWYTGNYHAALPAQSGWTAVTSGARSGEAQTGFNGLTYHMGQNWTRGGSSGSNNPTCWEEYATGWYYQTCWNIIPVDWSASYCANHGPAYDDRSPPGCLARYSIFVR